MQPDSHTPSIRIRQVEPRDLPVIFDYQSDPESNAMAGTKPRTREAFFSIWKEHLANPDIVARVIEIDGESGPEIVGNIARFQADGQDCVGYWIVRAYWGKGYASRALELFLAEDSRRPLHATTDSGNAPSQRILTRCGFRCTGRHMGEETDRFLAREVAEFVLE